MQHKKIKSHGIQLKGSNKAGRVIPTGFGTQQKDLSHGKGKDKFSAL